jgi:rhodanese-related sulfurtransferase
MRKTALIVLAFIISISSSCQQAKNNSLSKQELSEQVSATIPTVEFADKLKNGSGVMIIDVRTPEEFAQGHLKNAINIDFNSENFTSEISKLDKSKTTLIYCLSGGRSGKALTQMKSDGFKEVYNMQGGILKWKSESRELVLVNTTKANGGMSIADMEKLTQSKEYVLFDFNAEWCAPCKKMMPILEGITEQRKDKMTLVKVDADINSALLELKKIDGIPYLELYHKGKLVWQHKGFIDEANFLSETGL